MRKRFSGEDLKNLSREELSELAQEFELAVRKNSTKEKLIEALLPFAQKAAKKTEPSAKSAVKPAEKSTAKPAEAAKKIAGRPARTLVNPEKSSILSRPAKTDRSAKSAKVETTKLSKASKAATDTSKAKAEKSASPSKKNTPAKASRTTKAAALDENISTVITAVKSATKDKKAAAVKPAEKTSAKPTLKTSKTSPVGTPPKESAGRSKKQPVRASQNEPAKTQKTSPKEPAKAQPKETARSRATEPKKIAKTSASPAKSMQEESTKVAKPGQAKKTAPRAGKSATPLSPSDKTASTKSVAKTAASNKMSASSAKVSENKAKSAKRPTFENPVAVEESSAKKGRGRPPKKAVASEKPVEVPPAKKVENKAAQKKPEPVVVSETSEAKKRGRPAKKTVESQATAPGDKHAANDAPASDSAVKGLAHNFGKKADDAPLSKNKKGAAVLKDGVAMPIETGGRQKHLSRAEQIEKDRSVRHASLKTTMEIPDFQPVTGLEGPSVISEDELTGELPLEYGETRIVMQIRDPHWAYSYWEIPQVELKRLELEVGIFEFAHSHFVLRLHNVSQGFSQEIKLSEHARNWYIYLDSPQTVYQVELGMHSPTEGYTFIALSNLVQTPPDSVAGRWAAPIAHEPVAAPEPEDRIGGHEIVEMPQSPGIARITEPEYVYFSSVTGESIPHPGSSDLLAGQRLVPPEKPFPAESALIPGGISSFAMPGSFNAPGSFAMPTSPMPSSSDWTSAGVSSFSGRPAEAADDIFLIAAVEVVVYGRVKAGCELTFQGNPLRVRPDGSFSLRLALPFDSSHSIDLVATDPRTKKTRTIKAAVSLKQN